LTAASSSPRSGDAIRELRKRSTRAALLPLADV
jgi:hypothetical protein